MQDRNSYPRVTTVLHEGFAEGGLETWAVKEAFKKFCRLWDDYVNSRGIDIEPDLDRIIREAKRASREIMEAAARRGTAVHKAIETGRMLDVSEDDLASVQICYDSFLEWSKVHNFKPIYHEVPIWSDKHGYRGMLDCIGEVDGRVELLDWKTSNSIRLSYRCQTAAYWYGLNECQTIDLNSIPPLQGIRIVRFGGRSDKESQVKDIVTYDELIIDGEDEIAVDFNAFLAAKRIYDWKLKRK